MRKQEITAIWGVFVLLCGQASLPASEPEEFCDLFNGKDLAGWVNVNTSEDTWSVRDGLLVCSGHPIGVLRSEEWYENFVLHIEWRHMEAGGNSGIFLWSEGTLPAGHRLPKGLEVQMLDLDWVNQNKNSDGMLPPIAYVHGELFGTGGLTTTPDNPRGSRSKSIENRCKGRGEWNVYDAVCVDGVVKLSVNGKFVNGVSHASVKKGYLCLESEGSEIHFRNIRVMKLPPGISTAEQTAIAGAADEGKANSPKKGKPKFRVLYNQDASNTFHRGIATPQGVHQMVDEIADGGADVLLVNPNAQRVNYPSKVWQTYWDGYTEGDLSFYGDIEESAFPNRKLLVESSGKLAEHGDYLQIAFARCREKGITPGVSLRMNDMHDAPIPNSHLHSRFYTDNPQFHLKPLEKFKHGQARSWGSKGFDYSHEEVRDYFLALIRELAQGYDFDVMELDFLRFPYYFDRDSTKQDKHCQIMTGFVRNVREILNGTGRDIALVPRLASSPGAARQLGFDVQVWADERLIDGITVGNFLSTSWDASLGEYRQLVGPNIAIYASMGLSADNRDGIGGRHLANNYEMLRGFASGYLATGADGVNTFNYFALRYHKPEMTGEEFYGGLRQMRTLKEARSKPRIHVLSTGSHYLVESDMPEQVPVLVRRKTARRFDLLLATEAEGQKAQALVCYDGETTAEDLWLRIGYRSVGHAIEIRKGPEGKARKSNIAVFNVPLGVIEDGRNELFVTTDKVNITVLGIDLDIR